MAGNKNSGRKPDLNKESIIKFLTSIGMWEDIFEHQVDQYLWHFRVEKRLRLRLEDSELSIVHANGTKGESPDYKALKDSQKAMRDISTKLGLSNFDLDKLGVERDSGVSEEGEAI